MANDEVLIANPTPAAITVNSQTVKAGQVKLLTVSDASTDLYAFVCKGCVVATASKTNGTASVASTGGETVIDTACQLMEKGGHLLASTGHTALSAGTNSFAEYGL